MPRLNFTVDFETPNEQLLFELLLKKNGVVPKDLKVLPDTKELYDNDPVFRKLVKAKKDNQLVIDRYLNKQ